MNIYDAATLSDRIEAAKNYGVAVRDPIVNHYVQTMEKVVANQFAAAIRDIENGQAFTFRPVIKDLDLRMGLGIVRDEEKFATARKIVCDKLDKHYTVHIYADRFEVTR